MSQLLSRDEKLLDEPDYEGEDINFFSQLYDINRDLASEIINLKTFLDGLNYNSLYINEKLSNILEVLYRVNSSTVSEACSAPGKKLSTREETYRRLTKAKDYIESNFDEEVTLEVLANVSCMNQFHFLRKFKELFGETPYQYLTIVRLDQAMNMLKKKKQTITDVCFAVGFKDLSSFSKLFKRTFNVSPDEFRQTL